MSHPQAVPLFVLVALIGGLNALPARADDASCKPVTNAMIKVAKTPYHETAVAGGRSFEKIYTTTALYIGNGGHWIKTPATPQTSIDATRETGASFSNCKPLRTETVDGQAATVYAAHSQTTRPATSSDAQIWIGNANGLPLKTDADVQVGLVGLKAHTSTHVSTHMTYGNVQAPADAH